MNRAALLHVGGDASSIPPIIPYDGFSPVRLEGWLSKRCLSPWSKGLGTPDDPAIRFARGTDFGATLVRNCYGLSGCWPPGTDLTGLPANGGFYFQAFSRSVTLPAAGYDYNSDWTPCMGSLLSSGFKSGDFLSCLLS